MTSDEMASLKEGDTISYNDGRPGHSGVKAIVLEMRSHAAVVSFEDRADITVIEFADLAWTGHLTKCAS